MDHSVISEEGKMAQDPRSQQAEEVAQTEETKEVPSQAQTEQSQTIEEPVTETEQKDVGE